MTEHVEPPTRPGRLKADRDLLLGLLVVLVLVFALVGSNVAANHAPEPHAVPVGLIGSPASIAPVAASLARSAPGAYEVHAYTSLAAAQAAVEQREVYGAYLPGRSPLLLVASAASPVVAMLLRGTFSAAAPARGPALVVRDLVPPAKSDPNSSTAFSMLLSLILAGQLGAVLVFTLGQHRPVLARLATVGALGIGAGLVSALVTNVVVGAFPDHFLGVWGVAALFVLAIAVPIAGFQELLGVGGTAVGAVMFLVIGNPASGGGSAPELLPGFWRHVSQLLPPGAAVTAMRDVVYFDGRGIGQALFVLSAYVVFGAAMVVAVRLWRSRLGNSVEPG